MGCYQELREFRILGEKSKTVILTKRFLFSNYPFQFLSEFLIFVGISFGLLALFRSFDGALRDVLGCGQRLPLVGLLDPQRAEEAPVALGHLQHPPFDAMADGHDVVQRLEHRPHRLPDIVVAERGRAVPIRCSPRSPWPIRGTRKPTRRRLLRSLVSWLFSYP